MVYHPYLKIYLYQIFRNSLKIPVDKASNLLLQQDDLRTA